jgi:uncharacterized membrane protein
MAEKGSTGLDINMANALCYAPFVGWIGGIVLLIVEKNKSVKWNALNGLFLSLALAVISWVMGLTIVLLFLTPILMVAGLILQLVLAVRAYQGQTIRLPLVSGWADKVAKKF